MKKIGVLNKYDITVQRGIIGDCGEKIREISNADVAAVISDDNVAPIYLDTVTKSLQRAGFTVYSFVFPHGEENKNIKTVMKMVEFFAE